MQVVYLLSSFGILQYRLQRRIGYGGPSAPHGNTTGDNGMKRNLWGAALLAAAGSAAAQSSLTVFGVIDAGVSRYSAKSNYYSNTPLAAASLGKPSSVTVRQTALSNSGSTSSRLGFRGTEDLGGGFSAGFWLEAGYANDTGMGNALGNVLTFGRRSTVSFAGTFGEVRLGRDYTATFINDTVMDPFNTTGVGASLINLVGSSLAAARGPGSALSTTDNQVRASNAISYLLPANDLGVNGIIQYAFHENAKQSNALGSPSRRGQYVGVRIGYSNGPLDVNVAYGESVAADASRPTGAADQRTIKTANVGVSYDFGGVRMVSEVSRVRDQADNVVAPRALVPIGTSATDRYNGAMVGLSIPVGAGLIKTTYALVKYKVDPALALPTAFGAPDDEPSVSKLAIGYVHNLSKRTALYATVAWIRVKGAQKNPLLAISTGGPAFTSTYKSGAGYVPNMAIGYDFGIRHTF